MRARLADTTRPGRARSTIRLEVCFVGCSVSISVANMNYALVGYTAGVAR